jgi:hypothetical protein
VDGIQVGHVPDHVVVQQDAVAAEHGQRRSELNRALLVARAGDQLVVTKLDRLGRSSSRADWLNVPGRPYELDLPCSALSVPVGGSASGYGVRLLTEAVLNELQVDSGSG